MSPSQALGIGPVVSPAKHGVLLRGLMKPSMQQKKVAVPVLATEAAEMFKKLFKRGPWPDKADCYRLAIDITAVNQIVIRSIGRGVECNFRRFTRAHSETHEIGDEHIGIQSPEPIEFNHRPGDRAAVAVEI